MDRLALLVVLVAVVGVATLAYRRRGAADATLAERTALADVPEAWRGDGHPTWLIFTTPLCASCRTVESHLRAAFPHHTVHLVDVTEHPGVAEPYDVRRAPTTVLADPQGRVLARLVGAEAVTDFIGTDDPAELFT